MDNTARSYKATVIYVINDVYLNYKKPRFTNYIY